VRIPNAETAVIEAAKVRDYLLNPDYPDNRGKARLFAALGYERADYERFVEDLRTQHLTMDALQTGSTEHGEYWRIEAPLRGPRGSARIRSIWEIRRSASAPRLITAYRTRR
jgi:hypothetical protein